MMGNNLSKSESITFRLSLNSAGPTDAQDGLARKPSTLYLEIPEESSPCLRSTLRIHDISLYEIKHT